MQAEIITIGDEILIGQTVDTNSAWMGENLNQIGIKINQITTIQDSREPILEALAKSKDSDASLFLLTGGLGPTKDDITKKVLCEYFKTELERNQEVLEKIEAWFESVGRPILESNRQQADLPKDATILANDLGTASGMWFEDSGKIYVSMPGVPYEMKHLMTERVIPRIKERFDLPAIYHKTIMTEGIGESFLVELVKDWENSLVAQDIKIAYLPSPGIVRVRLTAEGDNYEQLQTKVDAKAEEMMKLVPSYIYGVDGTRLENAIGALLFEHGKTLSTAESCTGGYIAHILTSVPGSSSYFMGGVVSYDNEVKKNLLGVTQSDLDEWGAVSQAVVEQMAVGARKQLGTDFALATSGVAGPDGGTDEKPVGTVWIALASENGVYSKKYTFERNRLRNIRRAAFAALSLVRRELKGELVKA